jgi:hypothetical protein
MTIEPTSEQRAHFQGLAQGEISLAQFLSLREQAVFDRYRAASERTLREVGGQRTHGVQIDQILAGGEMPFHKLVVDRFPSPEEALSAFDAVGAERQAATKEAYVLAVRPAGGLPRLAKRLRSLSPLLSRILGTRSEKELRSFDRAPDPATGPTPETISLMRVHDQTTPFYMMNLNRYYPGAQYENGEDVSGEQAYNRYGRRIMPYLISVGGYPDLLGRVIGTLVGDADSPLHDQWSDFAMVYYPSRQAFLNMMTHTSAKHVIHRDAGLARAVLMPSTDWALARR